MDAKIIQPPKEKIVQPQKMGLLVENPVYKPFSKFGMALLKKG
jgi:ribonucleoside-diphosphate reductase beta chain